MARLASFGYYVGYRLANTSEPFRYQTVKVPSLPAHRQEAILSHLRKFSAYIITVQAFNEAGAGPKSNPVVAMTDEDGNLY